MTVSGVACCLIRRGHVTIPPPPSLSLDVIFKAKSFSRNGRFALTGGDDRKLKVFNVSDGQGVLEVTLDAGVFLLATSAANHIIAGTQGKRWQRSCKEGRKASCGTALTRLCTVYNIPLDFLSLLKAATLPFSRCSRKTRRPCRLARSVHYRAPLTYLAAVQQTKRRRRRWRRRPAAACCFKMASLFPYFPFPNPHTWLVTPPPTEAVAHWPAEVMRPTLFAYSAHSVTYSCAL
jgi:hypothetical protein